VVVLVEELRGRQTGGQVCAPVARDLIAQVFRPSGSSARLSGRPWLDRLVNHAGHALQEWLFGPERRR
jgi:hypothetical protein